MDGASKWTIYQLTGREKTEFLRSLVFESAIEPMVRNTAVGLMRGLHRDDHQERVARLHRFVRDSVPYHREPVEMFHSGTATLRDGGDCDDHAILLCALAWSLRYPFHVQDLGNPDEPFHYTCAIGMPPSDEPSGDDETTWGWYETIIEALPGEHVETALRRIAFGKAEAEG